MNNCKLCYGKGELKMTCSSWPVICPSCNGDKTAPATRSEAAQVPVMGEAVGWLCKNKGSRWFTESEDRRDIHISAGWEVTPLFEKPATSITQAELDALRKDAERYRWLRDGEKSAGTGMTDEAIDAHIAKERQS